MVLGIFWLYSLVDLKYLVAVFVPESTKKNDHRNEIRDRAELAMFKTSRGLGTNI